LPPPVLEAVNFLLSFAVVTALFALMFKYVPNAEISWRNVAVGSIGTALLFTIGKFLLGMYLGKASVGSPYGAAGSLVAVVVWIYYSAQIFFFGAEFTHAYAGAHAFKVKEEPETAKAESATQVSPHSDKTAVVAAAAGGSPAGNPPVNATSIVGSFAPEADRPVHVISQELERHQQERLAPISVRTATAQSKPKPQLLMAVGLGFVLGRAFDFVNGKDHGRSRTGT
jgi:hypothetical protein